MSYGTLFQTSGPLHNILFDDLTVELLIGRIYLSYIVSWLRMSWVNVKMFENETGKLLWIQLYINLAICLIDIL